MCRAEDQHPVQELTAQGADEALADRVHPRSLDGGAQDRGAGRLEDGVERGREVPVTVRNRKSSNRSSRFTARFRACCAVHSPVGAERRPGASGGCRAR